MPTCFVIQPFDNGKFDKRYRDIFKPAIEAAGFEAYRVDKDTHVQIPITSIEKGIRDCSICLADITTDNPNVWYELGFAFAAGKHVVMICCNDRSGNKYPFDIQHRFVISYSGDSASDYDALRDEITARIKAYSEQAESLDLRLPEASQLIAPVEELSDNEIAIIKIVASNAGTFDGKVSVWRSLNDAEKRGIGNFDFTLAERRLIRKCLVVPVEFVDYDGDQISAMQITEHGWDWIDTNESLFVPRVPTKVSSADYRAEPVYGEFEITDDDIPF